MAKYYTKSFRGRFYLPATGDMSDQFHFIPLHIIIRI
jgi:hypothetical protein